MASPLDTALLDYDMKDDLLFNLDKYSEKECSDPRDRVYALLSISSDGENMTVDYNKDILDVYTDVVRHYIEHGYASRVLLHALLRHSGEEHNGWPSWIPNWCNTRKRVGAVRHFLNFDRDAAIYNNRRKILENGLPQLQDDGTSSVTILQQVDKPRISNHRLSLNAWLVRQCYGSENATRSQGKNAGECCLYCRFRSRAMSNAQSIICLLEDSPCAFWLSTQPHETMKDEACYRLKDYINYVVYWSDGKPFLLQQVEGTPTISSFTFHMRPERISIV